MTKENAIQEATSIANKEKIVMVVCNDPISNNIEEEPEGPWGYCPEPAKNLLYRWADETIVIRPA